MAERFVGRDAELAHLLTHWDAVATDGGPRVVASIGESGVGKTRLVQAFYAALAAMHRSSEGRGYWPAELDVLGRNLTVNPALAAVDTREVPPFLWWGIRIADTLDAQGGTGNAVRAHLPHLIPHLEPIQRARALQRAWLEGSLDVGAAVAGAIPVVGPTIEVTKAAFELLQVVRGAWSDSNLSPQAAQQRAHRNLIDTLVGDLASILRPIGRGRALPMVLVIDDAQFASGDPSAVELLDRLLDEAHRMRWPLLIVLTYWQERWGLDWRAPGPPATIAAVVRERHHAVQPDWRPQPLGVMPTAALDPWLRDRLPGLPTEQASALLERAGGQPRFLDELTRHCLARRDLFEGGDVTKALSEEGLAHVLAASTDLSRLVLARLNAAPPIVARFVTLSSLQGMRVLRHVTEAVAERLGVEGVKEFEAAFLACEDPHAYLARVQTAMAEFTQRIFHEVAREHMADLFDEVEVREAWLHVLAKLVEAPLSGWSDEEVSLSLSVAAEALSDAGAERAPMAMRAWLRSMQHESARDEARGAEAAALRLVRGSIAGAWALDRLRFEELQQIQRALVLSQAHGVHADLGRALHAVAATRRERATAIVFAPDRDRLEAHLEAIRAWEEIAAASGERDDYLSLAAAHQATIGEVRWRHGDSAKRHAQAALDLYAIWGRGEVEVRRHSALLVILGEDALHPAEALEHFQKALDMRRRLHAEVKTRASARSLAVAFERVGGAYGALGDVDAAAHHFGESLAIFARLHVEVGTQDAQRNYGIALENVAELEWRRGDRASAIARMQLALELQAALAHGPIAGDGAWDAAERARRVTEMMLAEDRLDAALEAALRATSWRSSLVRARPGPGAARELADALELTADVAALMGDQGRSEAARERASAVRAAALEAAAASPPASLPERRDLALLRGAEAVALERAGQAAAASALAASAAADLATLAGEWTHASLTSGEASALETWGRAALALGDPAAALRHVARALTLRERGDHAALVGARLLHRPDALALVALATLASGDVERCAEATVAAHQAYEAVRDRVGDGVVVRRLAALARASDAGRAGDGRRWTRADLYDGRGW